MPRDPRPTMLLTRPEADARRFAAMMPGWPAVIAPIVEIVPVAHDAPALRDAAGLVFTSAHAVAAAGPGAGRPAICVGPRTARAARAAGFAVTMGRGGAEALLGLIAAAGVPLIHAHGRHLAIALPVPGMVVYDQIPRPLDDAARVLLDGPDPVILPVFSARSAALLSQAVAGSAAPLWLAAISDPVRAAFTPPVARAETAQRPLAAAMRRAIRRLEQS